MFEKLTKVMALIIVGFIIYVRDYYYLLIIVGIIFLAYKFDLHNKLYRLTNKISGNTKSVVKDRNKKRKYLKKLSKYSSNEI